MCESVPPARALYRRLVTGYESATPVGHQTLPTALVRPHNV